MVHGEGNLMELVEADRTVMKCTGPHAWESSGKDDGRYLGFGVSGDAAVNIYKQLVHNERDAYQEHGAGRFSARRKVLVWQRDLGFPCSEYPPGSEFLLRGGEQRGPPSSD